MRRSLPRWRRLYFDLGEDRAESFELDSSNLDQHAPGDDQYGYEDAGERWMPVHTVETIVRLSLNLLIAEAHHCAQ